MQVLIAVARFVARADGVAAVTNVPAVEPVHVWVPIEPGLTAPHEKMLVLFAAVTEKGETLVVPWVVFVTVTVLPVAVAVVPTAEKEVLQALIASLRLVASVAVALLVT